MTPYLAQIILLGFNYNPNTWQLCNGQVLPINQYTAMFALLGTTYGGNGMQTFALPDLRGRVPIHWGSQIPGLPDYTLGEVGGTQNTTLLGGNLPSHNHPINAYDAAGNSGSPSAALMAKGPTISGTAVNVYGATADTTMSAGAITASGGNVPVSILQPYLTLSYCIALSGLFPSRN